MPDDAVLAEHLAGFHFPPEHYGVEPAFDARRALVEEDWEYCDELFRRGVNPYRCEYWSETGCRVARELRPPQCRTFTCDTLAEALARKQASLR